MAVEAIFTRAFAEAKKHTGTTEEIRTGELSYVPMITLSPTLVLLLLLRIRPLRSLMHLILPSLSSSLLCKDQETRTFFLTHMFL
jgi:hypothetical protein